jgi:hypothetical protein
MMREILAPLRALWAAFNGLTDAFAQVFKALATQQALFWAIVSLEVGVGATLITNAIVGG